MFPSIVGRFGNASEAAACPTSRRKMSTHQLYCNARVHPFWQRVASSLPWEFLIRIARMVQPHAGHCGDGPSIKEISRWKDSRRAERLEAESQTRFSST